MTISSKMEGLNPSFLLLERRAEMISFNVQKAVFELFNKIIKDCGDMEVENIESLKQGIYFKSTLVDHRMYEYIIQTKGIDILSLNQTLHKSFSVYDGDESILFLQQILHYISTYGMKLDDMMYIPPEKLDIETADNGSLPITIIDSISLDELSQTINQLITSNIALKTNHVTDIFTIISGLDLSIDIHDCKNRELKLKLYDYYHVLPEDPDEFMKYLCYHATNSTLIVKNQSLYQMLSLYKDFLSIYLTLYVKQYGEKKLAECFYRWKNEILALKTSETATIINKVSRLSKQYHTTMPKRILDHISEYSPDIVIKELEKVSIYKKIQLVNLIQYRAMNNDISFYQIRNGASFIKAGPVKGINLKILNYLIHSIVKHMSKKVKGKYIHYPEYIDYALPSSQKNMLGVLPYGTEISLGEKCLIGIHWYNEGEQTDLDFSMTNRTTKLGWNAYWNDNDIWFSGDMTNAPKPNGAAEFYFVSSKAKDSFYNLHVNDFTEIGNVPYSLVVQRNGGDRDRDYVIKKSKDLIKIPCVMNRTQQDIGLLKIEDKKKYVYIANSSIHNGAISSTSNLSELLLDYYKDKFNSMIRFREILELSGAIFDKPADKDWDIDLTPQNLSADTFISLLEDI